MSNEVLSRREALVGAAVLAAGAAVSGEALAKRGKQPRMQSALDHLQQAKHALQNASHNKGGHRVAAIDLIDKAIRQVRLGMAASS